MPVTQAFNYTEKPVVYVRVSEGSQAVAAAAAAAGAVRFSVSSEIRSI